MLKNRGSPPAKAATMPKWPRVVTSTIDPDDHGEVPWPQPKRAATRVGRMEYCGSVKRQKHCGTMHARLGERTLAACPTAECKHPSLPVGQRHD
ncbi:MAG: hypothetical protein RLZZ436_4288 [Planctomycetota bacterium]